MKISYTFRTLISIALLLCFCKDLNAQTASSYTFSNVAGTYSYLSGGKDAYIEDDDIYSLPIPVGFTFFYMGTAYTTVYASSNGWVSFAAPDGSYNTNRTADLANIKRALMPLWDDLDGYDGIASYKTTGTAPNRVFTIEFRDWYWSYAAFSTGISFQVQLFETTNVIQFQYQRESGGLSSASATIGISGGVATDYLSVNGAGTGATASSASFTTSIAAKPNNGRIFRFNPPSCSTPVPGATIATPSAALCFGQPVRLSLSSSPTATGSSYQWQSSADGITYTNISGAVSPVYNTIPLVPAYYRCVVACSSGPSSVNSTPVFVNFSYSAPSGTPGTRCGTGTTVLSATASTGTLKWYTAPIGGTVIGTGSPYTTPVISATTTYYVGAESSSSSGSGTVGSGGSVSSGSAVSPFSQYFESNHSQYLVLAGDLYAAGFGAGNLTALSFNIITKYSTNVFSGYTLKLAHTTATAMDGGLISPSFSTVYGPAVYSSVAGANNFTFASAFNWDGISNILVDVCFDNDPTGSGAYYSDNDVVAATNKDYIAVYGLCNDDVTLCGALSGGYINSSALLPVITFTGNKVCNSPRTAVTATVNPGPAFALTGTQTVCNNAVAQLNVTSPLGNYTEYVWTPAASLYTDAACTTPYIAGSSAATVYAKTTVAGAVTFTCNASHSVSMCAAVGSVAVTTLPSVVTAVATPSALCRSGAGILTLTPSTSGFGAASFQWAGSADNTSFTDIAAATGNSYTTPVITASRYYRVTIKDGAGTVCLNSGSDTVLINNPAITGVTGASRCGPGPLTLSASGVDGVVNWYAAASGGSALGTGTTYTTPSLSATTTYYVGMEAASFGPATIGNGGSTTVSTGSSADNISPFDHYFGGNKAQYLFKASELTEMGLRAGDIKAIAFDVTSGGVLYKGFKMSIGQTSSTALTTTPAGSLTNIYSTTSPAGLTTPASGLVTITFSTPFNWNGTSNIVIETCWSNNNSGGTGTRVKYDVTSFVSHNYYRNDSRTPDDICGTTLLNGTLSARPKVVFTGNTACTSARTAVTATINPLPVPAISPSPGPVNTCEGSTVTLTGRGGGNYQWKSGTDNIPGATDSTYRAGVTGNYRVVVTNAAGCKDSSSAVTVKVNPSPTVSILPAATLAICADSSQKYTSVTTGGGLMYQWYESGMVVPGATTKEFTATTSGHYTLRVFLAACSDTSNEAVLTVNPLPPASFTETDTRDAICTGDSLELTALAIPAGSVYQWLFNGSDIPGATKQKYYARTGGDYSVRIRDANNCRKESDKKLIINTPAGIPVPSPGEAQFCEGTEITIYANGGPYADEYLWMKDGVLLPDVSHSINTALTGYYEVTVTDIYGCKATSGKVNITVMPLPVKPVITHVASMLSVPGKYSTYQWYRNGKTISGATKRTLVVTFDGKYHVVVTNSEGCYAISDTMVLNNLAVEDIKTSAAVVKIYPNPSQGIVYIEAPQPVNLLIRDLQGKQVAEIKDATRIDMNNYADGMYLFTIIAADGQVLGAQRIVKRTE